MTFNFTSDLACYSLSCNNNVPATPLDLNHYYTYRQQAQQQHPALSRHSSIDTASTPTSTSTPTPTTGSTTDTSTDANEKSKSKSESTVREKEIGSETQTQIKSEGKNAVSARETYSGLTPATSSHSNNNSNNNNNNSNNNNNITVSVNIGPVRRLSKLDLLIQTATSNIPLSYPAPTTPSSTNSFDILCNHAHKELIKSAPSSQSQTSTSTPTPTSTSTSSKFLSPVTTNAKISKKQGKIKRKDELIDASNSPTNQNHLAIKLASPSTTTKRQRSGPSCDCCRSRKIKCDSEIFILSNLDNISPISSSNTSTTTTPNSFIAHCEFIQANDQTGYQYYKIVKDEEHSLNNKLTSFNYLQFKPCNACTVKSLKCCFSKGFTRNDIIKFNKSEKIDVTTTTTNTNSTISQNNNNISAKITSIPTPSPTPNAMTPSNSEFITSSSSNSSSGGASPTSIGLINNVVSDDEDKKSKKTSCKTCRFKKIKCVKIQGLKVCMYCTKKSMSCNFE